MIGPRPEPAHVLRPRPERGTAFDELVAPHVQRLYRFLVLRLGDDDARDALQETLVAAWRALPELRQRDDPWPWLAGIAARKAADEARSRGRRARRSGLRSADDASLRRASDLLAALDRLPAPAREVLLARYLLRLSEEETAAALGVRVGTVKSRAARARRLLLEELE